MEIGYHVLEKKVLEKHDLNTYERISMVQFLKLVHERELSDYQDYTVIGLDQLFAGVDDPKDMSYFIYELLRNRASYLVNKQNLFQFVIKIEGASIQRWDGEPKVVFADDRQISLNSIFGTMEPPQDDPNWFYHQLNVQS